ncbi:hypothetical protein Tco_0371153 [Tanacetum coccineum]
MEDKGIFDSGCSGHMTSNKDHLDDFEECKGGSVTFGGSKGLQHTGKVSFRYYSVLNLRRAHDEEISPTTLEVAKPLSKVASQRLAEEEELTEQQKQRKAQVQFEAQHYTRGDKISGCYTELRSLSAMQNAQSIEEKEKEPVKKMGKRRKHIARKGLHTAKDEAEKDESLVKKMILLQAFYIAGSHRLKRNIREDLTELCLDMMKRYGYRGSQHDDNRRERKYPLSTNVCQTMLKMKLLDGKMNEDCYKLLKMMEKQAGFNPMDIDTFLVAKGVDYSIVMANRPVSRKTRTPRAVVIKEPPSDPVKKTRESSGKLKGIEMLSEVEKVELDTQEAIKASKRESRFQHKTSGSSEGASLRPEVPDDDDDDWGSTDEETNKDKIEDDDEDDVSEEEEDEEDNFSKEENVDEENSNDHEISKEGKTIAKTEEEEIANSEHEVDDTKGENKKSYEEPKGDDQAKEDKVGVLDLVEIKEKSEFLQSISNKEITSMMDIEIQQDVPLVQNGPFHEVKVSFIPESTQQLPSTPPTTPRPAIQDPATPFINFEAVDLSQVPSVVNNYPGTTLPDACQKVLQSHTDGLKKEVFVRKEEYKDYIQQMVYDEVKNQLLMILSKVVSDFATPVIQKSLTEFELKNILMEKMKRSQSNHGKDNDEDPSAGLNQGNETKKRRIGKESEYSKKSSTPKESTKGKPASKSSKTSKSRSVDKSVKEPEHEVQMDLKEPIFENVANNADEPQVDPKPKIQKKDRFKDSSKTEVLDPEWNIAKVINDTPKQPWFNQMVQAVKPPLTFNELMSTPIDFSAFAMNRP